MVLDRLTAIFRDVFDDDSIVLRNEMSSKEIEDWDSLAQINLIIAIKEEFHIDFSLEEATSYQNVGDMIQMIEEKLAQKSENSDDKNTL